ncbi:MAG TPA: hypothetical protein VHM28_04260 [Anaerolineales bacterium]|jgi:hypothetical protein|nr:hypothetical protein [Anaerolineales bacterium]
MKLSKKTGFVLGIILVGAVLLVSHQPQSDAQSNQIPITGQNASTTDSTVPFLSATISDVSGRVSSKQAGDKDFSNASLGTVLQPLGQVKTLDDGRARLDLSSGTIVRVAPSSLFTLESNTPVQDGLSTVLNLDLGKLFIILNGGSLDVKTPSGVASVHGSYMMVSIDPYFQTTIITCLEGHCSAENPAGTIYLTTGQKGILYFSSNGKFTKPIITKMTQDDYNTWAINSPESKTLMSSLGISYTSQSNQGNNQNCPKSRAKGCDDHPGKDK